MAHGRRPGRGVPGVVRLRLRAGPGGRARAEAMRRGSPPSRWRSRTRTTASTTSSTATTTSRTTAGWWPRCGRCPAAPAGLVRRHVQPGEPRVRALSEEAARVVRSRVLNPPLDRGHAPPRLQGAFELAATVDYLFGYDATARVVEDWMYERVTESYVADPEIREFFRDSNPWALRAIAERLLEAHTRDVASQRHSPQEPRRRGARGGRLGGAADMTGRHRHRGRSS